MARIALVITARPSFARIRTVLDELHTIPEIDTRIIFAASSLLHHYGQVERDCPYPIAHRVYSTLDGHTTQTSAIETGLLTIELANLFAQDKPDVVVTIADRHETLATGIAASYQNVPLAHLQGGEDTGNIDDRVRNAVSALADYHFPATDEAAQHLESMRVKGFVYPFGCPSVDLAARALPNPLYDGAIVVLQHPVTNEADHAREQIEQTLEAVLPFAASRKVLWFWPGQDAGSEDAAKKLREYEHLHTDRIVFARHLPAPQFMSCVRSAGCLVGNSSVGVRECAYLGTPVVDLGSRQQGRQRALNVLHAPHEALRIADAIRHQLDHGRYPQSTLYGDGRAGERIARTLAALVRGASPEGLQGGAGQERASLGAGEPVGAGRRNGARARRAHGHLH